jgi:hypothetical protein
MRSGAQRLPDLKEPSDRSRFGTEKCARALAVREEMVRLRILRGPREQVRFEPKTLRQIKQRESSLSVRTTSITENSLEVYPEAISQMPSPALIEAVRRYENELTKKPPRCKRSGFLA